MYLALNTKNRYCTITAMQMHRILMRSKIFINESLVKKKKINIKTNPTVDVVFFAFSSGVSSPMASPEVPLRLRLMIKILLRLD